MPIVTGNTFPVKDQLKSLGGKWNPDLKGWDVPQNNFDVAVKIVAEAPKQKTTGKRFYAKCRECSLDYREGGGMYNGGMSYYDSRGHFVLGDDD